VLLFLASLGLNPLVPWFPIQVRPAGHNRNSAPALSPAPARVMAWSTLPSGAGVDDVKVPSPQLR
jgi:hypothetical protein